MDRATRRDERAATEHDLEAEDGQSALRFRDFRVLWTGAMISSSGVWIKQITVPYVLFELTGSATWVGLAVFLSMGAFVVVAPLSGLLADRYPRRRLLLVANCLGMAFTWALAATWLLGVRSPLLILLLGAASSIVVGGSQPAWHSIIVDVVPPRAIPSAVSLNSVQVSGGRAIGPAVGGLILAAWGPGWAFAANALSFVAVLVALSIVHPQVATSGPPGHLLADLRAGAQHLWSSHRMRRALASTVAVVLLANPLQQLVAPFVVVVLDAGPGAIGALGAAYGAGSLLGAVLVPRVSGNQLRTSRIMPFIAALGLLVATSAASRTVALAVPLFFGQGCLYMVAISSLVSVFHLNADPALRGRVISLFLASFGLSNGLGTLAQSAFADALGIRATIAGAGALLLVHGLRRLILRRRGPEALSDPRLPVVPSPQVAG